LAFFVLVIGSVAILARYRTLNVDAIALGLTFGAVLSFAAATNLRQVHYVVPFYSLLCVFLAWAVASYIQRVGLQNPLGWRRWGVGTVVLFGAACFIGDATYAIELSAAPLSGIRSFAATQPLDSATLYVIAPNYMAATFAFYARDVDVHYGGFAQADHPEIWRRDGEVAAWNKPSAVSDELRVITREAGHYKYLDFIVDDRAANMYSMPFGKVWLLLNQIEAGYPLLAHTRYPGRYEPISVYRFLLGTASRPNPG
jgi:hypothetical protein